jgi:hypothetical protein
MAEREQDFRRQNILLDIGRTWTRLALEAEQWTQTNRPPLRLKKAPSKDRLTVISSIPSPPPAAPRARSDCQTSANPIFLIYNASRAASRRCL